MTTPRRGAPPKTNPRNVKRMVRLTRAEEERLLAAAHAAETTPSEFIRWAIEQAIEDAYHV